LRRKAFGIIRILIDNEWDFDIKDILKIVSDNLNMKYDCEKMDEFFKSRFETILLKEEMPRDVINAVLVNWNRPLRAYLAAQSIKEYLSLDKFKDFITAFQRIYNISKSHNSLQYQGRLFILEQEKELFQKYLEVRSGYESCVKEMNFKGVIDILIEMKPQIDNYFEGVFVMDRDESIRLNRLGFLKTLSGMFSEIGDVSRLYQ
jgi:glycyl-tRNA synthetase beta chain